MSRPEPRFYRRAMTQQIHLVQTADSGEFIPTVIIGGGQAGLAMGYHLQQAGELFVILDAQPRIGDTWRNRWDSLRLFTPPKLSSLPGWPMQLSTFPTHSEMADYLEVYAEHFNLPVRSGVGSTGYHGVAKAFGLRPHMVTCGQSGSWSPQEDTTLHSLHTSPAS